MSLFRYVRYKLMRPFSGAVTVAWRVWYAVEDILIILGAATLFTGLWRLMFIR